MSRDTYLSIRATRRNPLSLCECRNGRSTPHSVEAMSEVACIRIELNPESIDLIREWSKTMNENRRPEALATMIQEGVTIESYFLDRRPEGDYLIAYTRAASLDEAAEVAAGSDREIARYHREVKQAAWGERTVLEPLVDLATEHV